MRETKSLQLLGFTFVCLSLFATGYEDSQGSAHQDPKSPKPAPRAEAKRFSFELKECNKLGDRITCEVLITNNDQDRSLYLRDSIRIIDDSGNELTASKIKFGAGSPYDVNLATNIPVKASFVFEPVGSEVTHLALLEIYFQDSAFGDQYSAQLRDVTLRTIKPISSLQASGQAKPNVVISKEFTFVFDSCTRSAKDVICSFAVTNEASETRNLSLQVSCGDEQVRLIDDGGNEYLAAEGRAGSETIYSNNFGRCFTRENLVPRATTQGAVRFVGVDPAVKTIKLLRMTFGEGYPYGPFTVDFRDIPLLQPAVKSIK